MRSPIIVITLSLLTFLVLPALSQAAEPVVPAKPATNTSAIVPLKIAKLMIVEDFETTADGGIPRGFTKKGLVAVVSDVAHSGTHSLRLDAAPKGMRGLEKSGPEIAALGGQHWGRMFYRVQLPAPLPVGNGAHATLVAGSAQSPAEKDPIEVRMAGLWLVKDSFRYLYNVQPRKGRKEFAEISRTRHTFTDAWTLIEWYVDHASQSYRYFVNGHELADLSFHKGEGSFARAEIPAAFESLTFGWCTYQPIADPGFVVWIDDIAVGKDRIGDQMSVPIPKAKAKK